MGGVGIDTFIKGNRMLNKKQQLFMEHYLEHGSPINAYKYAGYNSSTDNSAHVKACKLLKNATIKLAIEKQQEKIMSEAVIKVSDIVKDLKLIRDASLAKNKQGFLSDPKSALRALELLGKTIGAYTDKQEINVTSIKILREDIDGAPTETVVTP